MDKINKHNKLRIIQFQCVCILFLFCFDNTFSSLMNHQTFLVEFSKRCVYSFFYFSLFVKNIYFTTFLMDCQHQVNTFTYNKRISLTFLQWNVNRKPILLSFFIRMVHIRTRFFCLHFACLLACMVDCCCTHRCRQSVTNAIITFFFFFSKQPFYPFSYPYVYGCQTIRCCYCY